MATVAMMVMGHSTPTKSTEPCPASPSPAVFHDFLGGKSGGRADGCSAFPAAASGSGGAPGPFPSSSDLASERQVSSFFGRISRYGPKHDVSVAEISNRLVGNKRNNSDPAFMASSRNSFPQMIPETSNVMKMLRNASGGERPRILHYDGPLQGSCSMGPLSSSYILQPTGSNINLAKSERLIPLNVGGSSTQYNSCVGQASHLAYQVPLSRSKDGSSGPSVLSQLAADEGSRTGNKGSGLFSSINASNAAPERNPSVKLPSGCKIKPGSQNSVPESSNPSSRRGLTSSSRQMTIIYGGQVHVFDDVHPNKADIIMALAGSSGGSWCTNLSKSLTAATVTDICSPIDENEASLAGDSSLAQKCHKVLNIGGNSIHGLGSNIQGGTITKDAGTSRQAIASTLEAKLEV